MPLPQALATEFSPYGTSKADMHAMPVTDTVFDVNYEDPQQLNTSFRLKLEDIHSFAKMVPMADAEIVRLQQEEGFAYMR